MTPASRLESASNELRFDGCSLEEDEDELLRCGRAPMTSALDPSNCAGGKFVSGACVGPNIPSFGNLGFSMSSFEVSANLNSGLFT